MSDTCTTIGRLAHKAIGRLSSDLARDAPALAGAFDRWSRALAGVEEPERYFTHLRAYPMLLLPWWLEETIHPPDAGFQATLIASTISGYYYTRLVDDLTDGHERTRADFLPALAILHTKFQTPYQAYFPWESRFWPLFTKFWIASWAAVARDARLSEIPESAFNEVAARKTAAAKIPVAAVCLRYQREDLLVPWCLLCDLFSRWHQMADDLFDWLDDLLAGRNTFFLCEARRRKQAGESVTAWVLREGIRWGAGVLWRQMTELRAAAAEVGSAEVTAYLEERGAELSRRIAEAAPAAEELAALAALLESPHQPAD